MPPIINTSTETILQTNHEVFRPYLDGVDKEMVDSFYGECGKEHFRFLAYLSSLYSNSTIVNIHTNGGYEALALSYNESNTVYSFDASDHITNPKLRERNNIQWIQENIGDPVVREKWRNI